MTVEQRDVFADSTSSMVDVAVGGRMSDALYQSDMISITLYSLPGNLRQHSMFVLVTVKNPFLRVRNEGRTLNIVTNFIIIIYVHSYFGFRKFATVSTTASAVSGSE